MSPPDYDAPIRRHRGQEEEDDDEEPEEEKKRFSKSAENFGGCQA